MNEELTIMPIKAVLIPLDMNADGVLRVGGTRVTLDTVRTRILKMQPIRGNL
jgi:hypothetical protein